MATPAITPQGGAAPQPGAGSPSPQQQAGGQGGGPTEGLKMLAAMTRLAQMISQQFAAASPDMEQVTNAVQSAMRKVIAQSSQQGQQAPPF